MNISISLDNLPDNITIGKLREMESQFEELLNVGTEFEKNNKLTPKKELSVDDIINGVEE